MKVVIQLAGGLGNQMFQYAVGRSLALSLSAETVVDDWSGFVRDKAYRRKYALGEMAIQARRARFDERLPFWIFRLIGKSSKVRESFCSRWFGDFIVDVNDQFREIKLSNVRRTIHLLGYWQSPHYFLSHSDVIFNELVPPEPRVARYQLLGREMARGDSIAIGIRLYEECIAAERQARDGKLKSFDDFCKAIDKVLAATNATKCFVFGMTNSDLHRRIADRYNGVLLTEEEGVCGDTETLWLLSQCKHHVFNNSTFYWWGAALSSLNHINCRQEIYAADNFLNASFAMPHWSSF